MDIARAEEFCRSYGKEMQADNAVAMAGHYGFPFSVFILGTVGTMADRAQADVRIAAHTNRFREHGLGVDIRLVDLRVEPVSSGSALCHLIWEIFPADSTPGWRWTNVYGLRQTPDSQHFEFTIADNEVGELLQRFPNFMDA
jgi:hypothetical protein